MSTPLESPGPRLRPLYAAVVLVGAAVVLAWGAAPYLPGQIDDAFIVFAYAQRVVEHGEIAWNTGERVEGYSSPLHLLLMVLGALAGLDLSVFARVLSFGAAVGIFGVLLGPRFGQGRAWAPLFLAAWQPLQLWSVGALETTLATLLACIGWPLALGVGSTWATGCIVLGLFSLARPEGAAWLIVGLLLRARHPWTWGAPERRVLAMLVALAGYHAARVAYFGHVFPTPFLVKIIAIDAFSTGATELAWEALSAAPVLALVLLLRRAIPLMVWVPLLIQGGLLLRAGGDWMGHARFLLPGVIGSVAAALAIGAPRLVPRWVPAVLIPLAAVGFFWEPWQMQYSGPRWRDPAVLARPDRSARTPWAVPLLDEVRFLIEQIPAGAGAMLSDVGLPGNLDDVRVWDGAGLTDRAVAEVIAGTDGGLTDTLQARYTDPTAIWCLRYGVDEGGQDPADAWMVALFPVVATQPDARGLFWRCREGQGPAPELVVARWSGLLQRFPRQDLLRWHTASALLDVGRTSDALAVARQATWIGQDAPGWVAFRPTSGDAYVPGRGWPLNRNGEIQTHRLPESFWEAHSVLLDVDDPGQEGARTRLRWEPDCGAPVELSVSTRAVVTPPPCGASPRALVVEFLNDNWQPPLDRNLYATLVSQPDEGASGP